MGGGAKIFQPVGTTDRPFSLLSAPVKFEWNTVLESLVKQAEVGTVITISCICAGF